jgi:hypothetical protein
MRKYSVQIGDESTNILLTTAQLAAELGLSPGEIRRRARKLEFEQTGAAGYVFTQQMADQIRYWVDGRRRDGTKPRAAKRRANNN